ncbi:MAG: hypothetical protein HY399_02355 [Elusimicrobia bacterium]|nr:hypothetical protein [Elusimicrobiota bacterium]
MLETSGFISQYAEPQNPHRKTLQILGLPLLACFLALGIAREAFGHGGIYVTRVFTSYGLYTLVPSYGISKGDKEIRIAGLYSWTEGKNTNIVFENSDIKGNSVSASASWMFFNRFGLSLSGSVLRASGPEPLDPRSPLGAKGNVTARGSTAAAAVLIYLIRRKHFQLPVIIGGSKLWSSADRDDKTVAQGGYPDTWNGSGLVDGLTPQFHYKNMSFTWYLWLSRHIRDTHESLKPVIASGEHPNISSYTDSLHGLEFTYDPWNLSLAYFTPSAGVQALALKWAYRL